jgi:hypothetical protein
MMFGAFRQKPVEIVCDVDIEKTFDSFHAYAVPEGIEINPGDIVQMHDIPYEIRFGDHIVTQCRATVYRAGWVTQAWTQLCGMLELTELYEVGFQPLGEGEITTRAAA